MISLFVFSCLLLAKLFSHFFNWLVIGRWLWMFIFFCCFCSFRKLIRKNHTTHVSSNSAFQHVVQYGQNPVWPTHSCIISSLILNYRSIIELDDQALNGKWQISLPVVQDMLTLIAIRIICLSHGSSFASLNNKLMFLCIC